MWLLNRFVYYGIIIPLSWLPFWILHRISDLLYFLIFYLAGYRKKVVFQSLSNSFPQKNSKEIKKIARKFYRHLGDLIVESVKLFSISKEELLKRYQHLNTALLDDYFKKNQSIIIVAGHYNNWEMYAQSCNLPIKHQAIGIYTPLTSAFFEEKFAASRGRYRVVLLPKNDVKSYFAENKDLCKAVIFGSDQSPSPHAKRVYWTTFLNQETAVQFGAEKYAKEYNYPVIFASVKKTKRSYYTINFELLEGDPASVEHGAITKKYTKRLEQQILEKPEYWLWTHKRWKRKRSDYPNQ
jgi:KDO2-lipid IV(A) lauroyltransferase